METNKRDPSLFVCSFSHSDRKQETFVNYRTHLFAVFSVQIGKRILRCKNAPELLGPASRRTCSSVVHADAHRNNGGAHEERGREGGREGGRE